MAKAQIKIGETEESVEDFLQGATNENVREDCRKISATMQKAIGAKRKM